MVAPDGPLLSAFESAEYTFGTVFDCATETLATAFKDCFVVLVAYMRRTQRAADIFSGVQSCGGSLKMKFLVGAAHLRWLPKISRENSEEQSQEDITQLGASICI